MSHGDKNFSIEFDFIKHRLEIQVSDGRRFSFPLENENVASFYDKVMGALDELGIETHFQPAPNELEDAAPFAEDTEHNVYVPEHAHACWQIFVPVTNILKKFRARFIGKCSPVHFFWGGFDLALTRFSGRRAPMHPGGVPHLADRVTREAYSHEVSSVGFWPGNDIYPQAAFYSYAYPAPEGYSSAHVKGPGVFYHPKLREFLLPYDEVRNSADPEDTILEFAQSAYEAAADLGRWDRHALEDSPFREECARKKDFVVA